MASAPARRVFLLVGADPRQRDWFQKWSRLAEHGEVITLLDESFRVMDSPEKAYSLMAQGLEAHNFDPEVDVFAWVWGNPLPLLFMGVLIEEYGADRFSMLQIRRDRRPDKTYDNDTLRFEPVVVNLTGVRTTVDPAQLSLGDLDR